MSRKVILTAYGTKEDRERLQEVAALTKRSQSEVLVELLRAEHNRVTKIPHP